MILYRAGVFTESVYKVAVLELQFNALWFYYKPNLAQSCLPDQTHHSFPAESFPFLYNKLIKFSQTSQHKAENIIKPTSSTQVLVKHIKAKNMW